MCCAGGVGHLSEMRNAYRILVRKPERKNPIGREAIAEG
jgi:hypothetical protein